MPGSEPLGAQTPAFVPSYPRTVSGAFLLELGGQSDINHSGGESAVVSTLPHSSLRPLPADGPRG
jgi:hypothetical protein